MGSRPIASGVAGARNLGGGSGSRISKSFARATKNGRHFSFLSRDLEELPTLPLHLVSPRDELGPLTWSCPEHPELGYLIPRFGVWLGFHRLLNLGVRKLML